MDLRRLPIMLEQSSHWIKRRVSTGIIWVTRILYNFLPWRCDIRLWCRVSYLFILCSQRYNLNNLCSRDKSKEEFFKYTYIFVFRSAGSLGVRSAPSTPLQSVVLQAGQPIGGAQQAVTGSNQQLPPPRSPSHATLKCSERYSEVYNLRTIAAVKSPARSIKYSLSENCFHTTHCSISVNCYQIVMWVIYHSITCV